MGTAAEAMARYTDVKVIFYGRLSAVTSSGSGNLARILPSQQPYCLTQIVRYVAENQSVELVG